jgi:ribulose-phosphate 3-epimerase
MLLAVSLLVCNFANVGTEINMLEKAGADWLHLDVMDGHFVPNLSFGPAFVKAIRPCTKLPFDVHLMIDVPIKYINAFAEAGVDIITFHVEACQNTRETLLGIKKQGVKVGLALKPSTPIESVFEYLSEIDMILIMTVEPGFGGQKFLSSTLKKIRELKNYLQLHNFNLLIEVDGGINCETAREAIAAGADVCVAGTSILSSQDPQKAIKTLKEI